MKTKIKDLYSSVKNWDKKNTSFHSGTYMLIFITAAFQTGLIINQAGAAL